jgi:hypothetical protein
MKREGEIDSPLLNDSRASAAAARRPRRSRSVTSLRSEFVSRLPDKVRPGLDPEKPFSVDLARAKGLTKGYLNHYLADLVNSRFLVCYP